MTASATSRAALGYPGFRRFQLARFLAVTGAEMQSVAVGWQLYELSHRAIDLGLAGLVQFLPGFVLVPWTGRTADRFRREKIVRLCQLGALLCNLLLLGLSVSNHATPTRLYAVLLLSGVVRAFMGPAGQALVPLLVERPHFPNAVAWASSVFQGATILGPILGGVIYAWAGRASVVYLVASCGFAVAAITASFVRPILVQEPSGGRGLSDLLAGFRCVFQRRVILGAMSLDLFAVLLGGAVALLPIYAKEVLRVGPWGLGLMRGAPGVGAVITAVLIAFVPLSRRAGPVMLACVAGFGAATIVFGLSRDLPLSLAALLCIGATDMISVVVRGTVVQLSTPDSMRGRVSSVNMLFIGASNELGQFESGLLAQWLGVVPAVVIGGIGSIVVVGLWCLLFPELRRIDKLTDVSTTGA
jgi:MFS family permease